MSLSLCLELRIPCFVPCYPCLVCSSLCFVFVFPHRIVPELVVLLTEGCLKSPLRKLSRLVATMIQITGNDSILDLAMQKSDTRTEVYILKITSVTLFLNGRAEILPSWSMIHGPYTPYALIWTSAKSPRFTLFF